MSMPKTPMYKNCSAPSGEHHIGFSNNGCLTFSVSIAQISNNLLQFQFWLRVAGFYKPHTRASFLGSEGIHVSALVAIVIAAITRQVFTDRLTTNPSQAAFALSGKAVKFSTLRRAQ
jgi:hypothetical protein